MPAAMSRGVAPDGINLLTGTEPGDCSYELVLENEMPWNCEWTWVLQGMETESKCVVA